MSHEVTALVLAAGMSQRMGRPKMLLPFGDCPMLARVVETLTACSDISQIIVVTGHIEEEIQVIMRDYPLVSTVHNANYAAGGMLSSVQTGVQALPADSVAFFLALGDQPAVRPETLTTLLKVWRETQAPIALPTFNARRGHPVLFSAHLAPEILSLPADATLKAIITRYAAELREAPVPDPAICWDIDTPEDYERALREWKSR